MRRCLSNILKSSNHKNELIWYCLRWWSQQAQVTLLDTLSIERDGGKNEYSISENSMLPSIDDFLALENKFKVILGLTTYHLVLQLNSRFWDGRALMPWIQCLRTSDQLRFRQNDISTWLLMPEMSESSLNTVLQSPCTAIASNKGQKRLWNVKEESGI